MGTPASSLSLPPLQEHITATTAPEIQVNPPTPNEEAHPECLGVLVLWQAGSVWDTYPYHQHGIREYPWEPIGFDGNEKWIRLRSRECVGVSLSSENFETSCQKCRTIPASAAFVKFQNRAMHAEEHTPYAYLSQRQLQAVLLSFVTKYKRLSLKVRAPLHAMLSYRTNHFSATKYGQGTQGFSTKDVGPSKNHHVPC